MVVRSLVAALMLASPVAALASESTQVPEGSNLTLFALGLLGVIVGRRLAMRGSGED